MKKFFMFAAMASVALVSCVKNDPANFADQGDAIVFNNPVVGLNTKALPDAEEIDGLVYPESTPFTVNAWYMLKGNTYAGTGERYMVEVNTTMVDAAGSELAYYKPVEPYYWPKNGTLSFIAYSPTELPTDCSAEGVDASGAAKDKLVITYVTPNAADDQRDLMYSDWACDEIASVDGNTKYQGLDIAFHHALSVVKVCINAVDDETATAVRIGTVRLNKIHKSATFTSEFGKTPFWTEAETDDTYTVLNIAELDATGNSAVDAASGKLIQGAAGTTQYCNYILMPQTLTDDMTLTIDYFVKHGNEWLPQNATLQLNEAKDASSNLIGNWVMNKKYNYNVSIKLNPIFFAPAIVEWAEATVSKWDITE